MSKVIKQFYFRYIRDYIPLWLRNILGIETRSSLLKPKAQSISGVELGSRYERRQEKEYRAWYESEHKWRIIKELLLTPEQVVEMEKEEVIYVRLSKADLGDIKALIAALVEEELIGRELKDLA
jgi:hypothetical protein